MVTFDLQSMKTFKKIQDMLSSREYWYIEEIEICYETDVMWLEGDPI